MLRLLSPRNSYRLRALATFLASASLTVAANTSPRPNVVFILADDLGWADIAVPQTTLGHPSDFYETPNLQRLANEGMAFTTAYACPNCAPTRAAITSGQYAPRTRVYNVGDLNRGPADTLLVGPKQNEDVAAALTTLAEMFKSAGYVTAHVGKYHVGGHEGGATTLPLAQGFDFNFGGSKAGNAQGYFAQSTAGAWKFHESVDASMTPYAAPYDAEYRRRYRSWALPSAELPASLDGTPKHVGDAVTDAALDFMEQHRRSGTPFFLEFNEFLVHTPLQGRPDLVEKYRTKKSSHPSHHDQDKSVPYAAMVEQFDQQVGRLLAYLDDPNGDGDNSDSLAANTLVVFFSDNGGERKATSNFPLRGAKGMFTEGGLRVPLIARMPGTVPRGTVNDTPAIMVDFYPTFAELAGAKRPDAKSQPLDGVSLLSVFFGREKTLPARALYWHFPGYLDDRAAPCSTIIRSVGDARYKLLYFYEQQTWSLYNLTADLAETRDLFADAASKRLNWNIASDLSIDLRRWLDDTGAIYPTARKSGAVISPPTPLVKR